MHAEAAKGNHPMHLYESNVNRDFTACQSWLPVPQVAKLHVIRAE